MEIHRYETLWFGASLLLIVGFIATITYGAVGVGIEMINDDGGTVDPDNLGDHERFGDTGVHQINETHYEVNMIAVHPSFIPGQIEIPEESTVTFYITAGDVTHGFNVAGTNINAMVIPGQITEITAEFDETGEFGYVCNEYCGSLHHTMAGTISVVPQEEFDLIELSTDVPNSVQTNETLTLNATVTNDEYESLEETVTFEVGDNTFEKSISVESSGETDVSLRVDPTTLGTGDYDWQIQVAGHSENGQLTIEEAGADGGDS
jgi:cytochrome c oxidase subunit 2